MGYYELMHKDVVACVFALSGGAVVSMSVNPECNGHSPLVVSDKKTLSDWLHSRSISATRQGLYKLAADPFIFMLENYGLSLSDCYWIKPIQSDECWSNVNFYENKFNDTAVLDSFELDGCGERKGRTPSASLGGDLQKKWVLQEGTRLLVKGNSGNTSLQSVAEVMASAIYKKQGIESYTEYDFYNTEADGRSILGCCCENFTTTELEFIPAIDIINSVKKRQDHSYYQTFTEVCVENGIADVEVFMSNMLAVDFMIVNVDRHLSNFGILRNPDTLEWVKMAPVFDSGNSLFYNSYSNSKLPSGVSLVNTPVNSFTESVGAQTRLIKYCT